MKNNNFYPYALNLKDRKVLVFGGGNNAYRELLRLVDAGCFLTIVAENALPEISELAITYGSRADILPVSLADFLSGEKAAQLGNYDLAFLLADSVQDNLKLAAVLAEQKVPCHFLYEPEASDFVPASQLKRGHLKIAVTTDGICQPLEAAILRRIEELFVYDFDHYSLFLAAVEERLSAFKDSHPDGWSTLNERLEHEDFFLAISRKNFEEALKLVDNHIDAIKSGRSENDEEEELRPRFSKGVAK